MIFWLLALVLLASLAGLGYRQGAIRMAFSSVGILLGALLAGPLGKLLKPLLIGLGLATLAAGALGTNPVIQIYAAFSAYKADGSVVWPDGLTGTHALFTAPTVPASILIANVPIQTANVAAVWSMRSLVAANYGQRFRDVIFWAVNATGLALTTTPAEQQITLYPFDLSV